MAEADSLLSSVADVDLLASSLCQAFLASHLAALGTAYVITLPGAVFRQPHLLRTSIHLHLSPVLHSRSLSSSIRHPPHLLPQPLHHRGQRICQFRAKLNLPSPLRVGCGTSFLGAYILRQATYRQASPFPSRSPTVDVARSFHRSLRGPYLLTLPSAPDFLQNYLFDPAASRRRPSLLLASATQLGHRGTSILLADGA